jgi:PhoPQ-activated pathogenicity-related protein
LPKFSWTLEKDGSIRVVTKDKPAEVKLWQATNPEARDFRIETLGPKYTSTVLADQGGGVYVGKVPEPAKGWTAFFVELAFPSGNPAPFKFTTEVRVLPDTLPYKFVPKGRPE